MDINKNQQTNTFYEGMNTDTSDMMLKDTQYRFAKNLRLVTDSSSNSGELRLIEGRDAIPGISFNKVIATTSVRDIAIVIEDLGLNQQYEYQGWNIYKIIDTDCTKIFGPCTTPLGTSVSLVTRYEDDDNIKLYIADGKNPLMYINVALNPSTPPTDISYISSFSERVMGYFGSFTKIAGNLKPGIVQYAYILYNKYGNCSQLSPLSAPQVIAKSDEGYDKSVNSAYGFQFLIEEAKQRATPTYPITYEDNPYDKIKVYRILYQEVGQDPTIDLIIDDDLNETSSFQVTDTGTTPIKSMSVAEFLSQIKMMIIPKEIESKNDYLFASNVSYQLEENSRILQWFYSTDFSAMPSGAESNLNMAQAYDANAWGYDSEHPNIKAKGTSVNQLLSWELKISSDQTVKSLRRNEVYRYGIVLYDKYGNPWPVKWVLDLRTPDNKTVPSVTGYNGNFVFNPLVLDFKLEPNFNWGSGDDNFFQAYEIVRCNRTINDRFTITQGILGRATQCYKYRDNPDTSAFDEETKGTTIGYLCPSGFLTPQQITIYSLGSPWSGDNINNDVIRYAKSSNDILLFSSPEYCYQPDDIYNIINNNSDLYMNFEFQFKDSFASMNTRQDSGGRNIIKYYPASNLNPDSTGGLGLMHSRVKRDDNDFVLPTDSGNVVKDGLYFMLCMYIHLTPHSQQYTTPEQKEKYQNTRNTICNVIIPHNIVDSSNGYYGINNSNTNKQISEIKQVVVPEWYQFANGTVLTYNDASTAIGGKNFLGWSVPTLADFENKATVQNYLNMDVCWEISSDYDTSWIYSGAWENLLAYPIGAVGRSLLIKSESNNIFNDSDFDDNINTTTLTCSIRRNNITPYGGYSNYARTNSTYCSKGWFNKVPQNRSQSDIPLTTYGDCYIQWFYYNALKTWYHNECKYAPNMSTIYKVPVESDIDMTHDHGQTFKRSESKYTQDEPAELRGYTQSESAYLYNTAYGIDPNVRTFTGLDKDDASNVDYDYRICYSDIKENNEAVDSWQNFKSANYIDVDTRYGQITDLRLFKDTLVFWQEQATGVLSVNERTLIQDVNDTNIILGNGDVLQRYDYLTTEYGMKPDQYADCQSNTTLYWWDGYRKDILAYAGGQTIMPMKKVKTISNYINSNNESTHPVIAYDVKYDELLMNVVHNTPLAYSEVAQQFISEYNTPFEYKINLKDRLWLLGDNISETTKLIYEWNKTPQSNDGRIKPYVKYVVNTDSMYNKVFDITTFGGRFYGGELTSSAFQALRFTFKTPLKQESRITDPATQITNREYDFRLTIPRAGKTVSNTWVTEDWGDRMRGKTMECEFSSESTDKDFSLQYITTKFRMSWS